MQDTDFFKKNGGQFLISVASLKKKMKKIKAFIFDWDGVFNDSSKRGNGESYFTEVDSMGINMLRFSSWMVQNKKNPICAVISGEENANAKFFLKREHFNAGYFKAKDKRTALKDFCVKHKIEQNEIAFVFDDILDLSIASSVGVRILIRRSANPVFMNFAKKNKLADYITGSECGNFALREASELMIALNGNYDNTMQHRIAYSSNYGEYLTQRNKTEVEFFNFENNAGL